MKFKNGSIIIPVKIDDETIRGERSNFISCVCYDIENDEMVFVIDFDMRKPLDRFIPEWYFMRGLIMDKISKGEFDKNNIDVKVNPKLRGLYAQVMLGWSDCK